MTAPLTPRGTGDERYFSLNSAHWAPSLRSCHDAVVFAVHASLQERGAGVKPIPLWSAEYAIPGRGVRVIFLSNPTRERG